MAMLPFGLFHTLFAIVAVAALFLSLFSRWMLSLTSTPILFLIYLSSFYLVAYLISHIFSNLLLFAGHGDPISIGQSKKLFPLRTKCENCDMNMKNVKRYGQSVHYEYDNRFHFYGPCEKDSVKDSTTIVFLHGNGIPACCFWFIPQIVLQRHPNVNVCLLEYPGYGLRGEENASIYQLEEVRQGLVSAWAGIAAKYPSKRLVLAGLSLGGGKERT